MIRRISLLFSQILLWVVLCCDAYYVPGPPALLHQPQHGAFMNQRGMARTLLMAAAQENNDTPNSQQQQTRWDTLPPQTKSRLVEAGQARAVNNKSKRESEMDKKRRRFQFVAEQQRTKRSASRVARPLPLDDRRAPLTVFVPGMTCRGVVISLTDFGAYVDVGTEVDGLLHVSQLSATEFVSHPRQVLTPGEEITVTVRARDPERKKLQLTMLPPALVEAQLLAQQQQKNNDNNDNDTHPGDCIPLHDIQVDDELWGELKRVTNFGAYVEVGAVVDGFLHFMDHPDFVAGMHPADFLQAGDRVRVWVADVDQDRRRVKLTAWRPAHLPGPRRDFPM